MEDFFLERTVGHQDGVLVEPPALETFQGGGGTTLGDMALVSRAWGRGAWAPTSLLQAPRGGLEHGATAPSCPGSAPGSSTRCGDARGSLTHSPSLPHQLGGSGRGSLASDGRTNSWASGGKGATLTHLSQNSGSFHDAQSFVLLSEGRMLEDPLSPGYSQPLHVSETPKPGTFVGSERSVQVPQVG